MTEEPELFPLDRLELSFTPRPWDFAVKRRAEIEAYFADLQQRNPAIWNGRVLLLHHQVVRDGVFRGDYLETDYASFAAWRHWGSPAAGVRDCFAAAAVVARDGAVLLGVMAPHTFNAGDVYFPSGTPDPGDIVGGKVDLDVSVRRELKEETGLDIEEFDVEPGWSCVADGGLIVQVKLLRSNESADDLRARILTHLRREKQPELSDIVIVRSPRDFVGAMPRFVTAFLAQHFALR
jgi:NUDIX domain-containing protein